MSHPKETVHLARPVPHQVAHIENNAVTGRCLGLNLELIVQEHIPQGCMQLDNCSCRLDPKHRTAWAMAFVLATE